jgi:FtsH-binding integral membrane protein
MSKEKGKLKKIDRDTELLKIQIYADSCHARYTLILSSVFAVVVSFLVGFNTLYYEKIMPLDVWIISIIVVSAFAFYEVYRFIRRYKKDMKEISDMIEKVKEGRELPRLEEL